MPVDTDHHDQQEAARHALPPGLKDPFEFDRDGSTYLHPYFRCSTDSMGEAVGHRARVVPYHVGFFSDLLARFACSLRTQAPPRITLKQDATENNRS